MNKLNILKSLGFKMSWKLVSIGLFGDNEIPAVLTYDDVVEYLHSLLIDVNEQTDIIVALLCEKNNPTKFDDILKKLASEEKTDLAIQKRKWRVYLLKSLMDDIGKDSLQGLLELMEFWVSMGHPNDCPQTFPNNDSIETVQDYFTQASYEINMSKNREWLNKEILKIVNLEM